MRIAIIGIPRTRYVIEAALDEAKDIGLDVVLVDSCEAPEWAVERVSRGGVFYVRSALGDLDAVTSVVRSCACDRIVSLTEFQMVNAARIRARLNIPGEPPSVEESVIDKAMTRELLAEHALTRVSYAIADGSSLRGALSKVGLPAIVKPRDLTGSIGVHFVDNQGQLSAITARYRRHPMIKTDEYLVESFITGPEISVEGLVVGGEFHVYSMTDKRTSESPYFIEVGHSMPSARTEAANGVVEYLRRIIGALDIGTAPIHAELRLSAHGPELVEIHTRYGGDYITRLLQQAYGYQVFADYFRALACSERPSCNRPARGVASVEFFSCGPGVFRGLKFPDWFLSSPGLVEASVDTLPNTVVSCEILPMERVGHALWLSPSHLQADADLERLRSTVELAWGQEGEVSSGTPTVQGCGDPP